jgi:hypothetical protein
MVGALSLVLLAAAAALLIEPASLRTPWAFLLPPAIAGLVGGYSAIVIAIRRASAGDATGLWCGLIAGALWSVEIFGGGPAKLSRPAEVAVGATFSLAAVAVTVAAGLIALGRHRTRKAAWRAGLYTGLLSGAFVFIFGVVMTLTTLGPLGSRSDYQQQYATSGAPSMSAFLVQDILTATCSHLIINLFLGVVGAGLASLAAIAVPAPTTQP